MQPAMVKKLHLNASRLIFLCGAITCLLFLLVLCMKIKSMPFCFDEYLHAHYLWLVSIGRVPHIDFWCHYPALGYVIVRPFFQLFPESIYTVLALRYFGLCFFIGTAVVAAWHARRLGANWLWGVLPLVMVSPQIIVIIVNFRTDAYAALAAILALTLMFQEQSPVRSGLVGVLSVVSVIIMPKYVYPLAFGGIACLVYGFFKGKRERQSLIYSAFAGGLIAALLAQCLLLTSHVWLWDDVYWSPVMMQRYFSYCAKTVTGLSTQLSNVGSYFLKNWWSAILYGAGISGWLITELKRRDGRLWVGTGILAGIALSWGTVKWPWNQYLLPGLYCLTMFVPYVASLFNRPLYKFAGGIVLISLSTLITISNYKQTSAELASGSAFRDFNARESFLKMIPRNERVVGFFRTHPCFREDLTFVTWDESWGTPKGFAPILPENSRVFAFFQPGYLKKCLEKSVPPASMAGNVDHYPLGWNQVLHDYLMQHSDLYIKEEGHGNVVFFRKDIAR
jgi:hypothetical protein